MKALLASLALGIVLQTGCVSNQPPPPLSPQDQVRIAGASEVYEEFIRDIHLERFDEAASFFTADARMTNHALMSAKGPAEIQEMLRKLQGRELFLGQPSASIKGEAVVLSGDSSRTQPNVKAFPGEPIYVGSGSNVEFSATLKQGPDGAWRFTYFETFVVARAEEQGGSSPQQDLGSTSTP